MILILKLMTSTSTLTSISIEIVCTMTYLSMKMMFLLLSEPYWRHVNSIHYSAHYLNFAWQKIRHTSILFCSLPEGEFSIDWFFPPLCYWIISMICFQAGLQDWIWECYTFYGWFFSYVVYCLELSKSFQELLLLLSFFCWISWRLHCLASNQEILLKCMSLSVILCA